MTQSSEEYTIVDVLALLSRIWIWLTLLPSLVGLAVGYWAHLATVTEEARTVQTSSVVSMPPTDRAVIDLQGLFTSIAVEQSGGPSGKFGPNVSAAVVFESPATADTAARSFISLVVQARSAALASKILQTFTDRLRSIVDSRSAAADARRQVSDLNSRTTTLRQLWDRLALNDREPSKGQGPVFDLAESIRSVAVASLARALLEQEHESARLQSDVDGAGLKIEVPPNPPAPLATLDPAGPSQWLRLPVAAALGTGLLILLLAFGLDSIKRAREHETRRTRERSTADVSSVDE